MLSAVNSEFYFVREVKSYIIRFASFQSFFNLFQIYSFTSADDQRGFLVIAPACSKSMFLLNYVIADFVNDILSKF